MRTINFLQTLTLAIAIVLVAGCSTTQRNTQSSRTAVEQLLLSEAVKRSFPNEPGEFLLIPRGASVAINTVGMTPDQAFLQQVLAGWLGQRGYLVQKDGKDATHRVDVVVEALGTELSGTFMGMPPVQSQFIPFSLPELALYKSQYQTGYAKFRLNVFGLPAGNFLGSTSAFLGDAYYNDYTVLFMLSHTFTDLPSVPERGSFNRKPASPRGENKAE
ncbi:hypothetical protein SAMN05216404_106119 [Nitrosospira multiformis]|uniref:DUF4136 domain-containing protein n=1 Tax=Nitrosospira multiformis TaxID=1231 RepID=A0A1H8ILX2_9PROT|nr:hypothetical protein [Nitrosospira multiformis]SEN69723.1 hypothetical protein SAMN05216404_106119 [Nitrosospira multiformis]